MPCLLVAVLLMVTVVEEARAGPGWLTIETGVQIGAPLGVEGQGFSRFRAVSEIGVLEGRDHGPKSYKGRLGAVLYSALSGRELVLGIKPRLRVDWGPTWSSDFTAGYIFYAVEAEPAVSTTGFASSATLNHGNVYSLKLDLNTRRVDPWQTVHQNVPRHHPGGTEVGLWAGLSFRDQPGWITTGITIAAVLTLTALVFLSGGAS